ncbi:MAG: ABC transporter ATP-binding protein [Desulfovibrionaceae bacterium]
MTTTQDLLSIRKGIQDLFRHLPSAIMVRFGVQIALMTFVVIFETAALAMVAIFATSITNPDTILHSSRLAKVWEVFPQLAEMDSTQLLLGIGAMMLAMIVSKNALRALSIFRYTMLMGEIAAFVGHKMMSGILRMPYAWISERNPSELYTTIQFAANTGNFLNNIFTACSELLLLAFMLALLVAGSPPSILASIAVVVCAATLLIHWMRHALHHVAEKGMQHKRASMREALVALNGLKDVRIHSKEQFFCDRFSRHLNAQPGYQARQELFANLPGMSLEIFGFGMLFLLMYAMYFLLDASPMQTTGILAMFAVFAWRGLPAAIRVVNSYNKFHGGLPYVRACIELLDEIDVHGTPTKVPGDPVNLNNVIHFDQVRFRYSEDGPEVLQGVNFRLAKGASLGIIGESGSGKSTIADILVGLLEPTNGALRVDGHPLHARAGLVGCIPQTPYILDASIAENIAFGIAPEDIDQELLAQVGSMAAVDEFVRTLPEGYNTVIGERGVRLSGGQRQRICIARALYPGPRVLLFDEATSSLDSKNERHIQETIRNLKGRITMIIIAHRMSTVRDCDHAVWIHDGVARAEGAPDTVLEQYEAFLREADRDVGNNAPQSRQDPCVPS